MFGNTLEFGKSRCEKRQEQSWWILVHVVGTRHFPAQRTHLKELLCMAASSTQHSRWVCPPAPGSYMG